MMHLPSNVRILTLYIAYLVCVCIYSFVLIDPNLTLVNHPMWESFRGAAVQFGYLNRYDSWHTYIVLILVGFFLHNRLKSSLINPLLIASITALILVWSYPFGSHDLFNYIFDARIFTHYGANPYTHIPADFVNDPWLRFMHWTHRPYPYGPVFLAMSVITSWLGFGKLILNFILFKGLAALAYVLGVWILNRLKPAWALFFATHPLIIFEGLVNAHNDLLAVTLGLYGIFLLTSHSNILRTYGSRLVFALSGGIKFFTLPFLILQKPGRQSRLTTLASTSLIGLIVYVSYTGSIQQWYFLNLFALVPYYFDKLEKWNIFFGSLLLSYFSFIRYGEWASISGFDTKTTIIIAGLVLQILYLSRGHLTSRKVVANKM